jgi:hypothetical protein
VHRQVAEADCWVTDILEGDNHFAEGNYKKAQECYQRVLDSYQQNPWGLLKMKELKKVLRLNRNPRSRGCRGEAF